MKRLVEQGKVTDIITQNIDGLHLKAGNSRAKVIEVHGTMHWSRCWDSRCGVAAA